MLYKYTQTHSAICKVLFMAMNKVQCKNTAAGTDPKENQQQTYIPREEWYNSMLTLMKTTTKNEMCVFGVEPESFKVSEYFEQPLEKS